MVAAADDMPGLICHPDRQAFERALKGLGPLLAEGAGGSFGLLCDLLGGLQESDLSSTELSARADILLKSAVVSAEDQAGLATMARSMRAELKTVIISFLPPALKRHVYSNAQAPPTPPARRDAPPPREEAVQRDGPKDEVAGARTVLLLGHGQDHEINHAALKAKNFTPFRVRNLEELRNVLKPDVCGIVVASSWWTMLPLDGHEDFLKRLIGHSTFVWLKIDVTGIHESIDAHRLCQSILFRQPGTFELTFQSGCEVHVVDISSLQKASDLLSCSSRVQIRPADIDEVKARVLAGATTKHVDGRHLAEGAFRMDGMATTTMRGGRSTAMVIRVDPDDGGPSLVAKIDGIDRLRGEMHRFHRFIAWSNPQVSPTLHFHAGTALIAFHLVECPESPGGRAPTLEESIGEAMSCELWKPQDVERKVEDLSAALDRSIEKLRFLNCKRCDDAETECWAYLGLDAYEAAARAGIVWTLTDFDGREIDLNLLRRRAQARAEVRMRAATVHGDAHLRNILVRDGREPYFIDYAFSGPGHPCFDLARLESALLYNGLRMTEDESKVAALLCGIAEGRDDESGLAREFPHLLASPVNRMVVRACIRCRAAALELVKRYDGGEDDYLAVRLIIACQSLLIPHLQTGVVRASIVALAARIGDRWADHDMIGMDETDGPRPDVRELSPL